MTTKKEDEIRCNHVNQMSKRERELTNDIEQLDSELFAAKELRDAEVRMVEEELCGNNEVLVEY